MLLCLDMGNHQLYGGVSYRNEFVTQFRFNSRSGSSSDEIGVFLRSVLRENGIEPNDITSVALLSVVPSQTHSLASACIKYFDCTPFILKAGVNTGLTLRISNPKELGSDRLCNAIAAADIYPNRDLVIIDFGTATTLCAINKDSEYLGGMILAGMKISLEALAMKTAQLPMVEIKKPEQAIGLNTESNLQSGVYFGALGAVRELTQRISNEAFEGRKPLVIGTGGFGRLFNSEGLFDEYVPDLILIGLKRAFEINL